MAACGYRDSHKRYYGTSGSWLNITQQMPDRAEKSSAAGECVVRHLDPQSVEGGLHVGRQLAAQLFVIEIGMEIGQDRAAGLDPRDPRERVLDTEMARMRPVAQRVHDPDFGAGKGRDAGLRQAAEVAGIGEPAEAESQGGDIAMLLEDRQHRDRTALPVDGDASAGRQPVLGHDRRIFTAGRRLETIAEAGAQHLRSPFVEIDVDPPPPTDEERAQVVNAVGVVRVLVGEEHRVKPVHLGVEKLLAQIRRGIDQNTGDAGPIAPLHQQRRAPAAVSGVARIARAPAQRGARNATRGTGAEDREARRHAARRQARAGWGSLSAPAACGGTLRKRRKKFSLVWRAISSGDIPRVSARTLAVSTT